jgi:hypothetical protein
VGVIHALQFWLHPQGISKISKTNMLIGCELRNTLRSRVGEKRTIATGRAREQCDRYAVGTHFENVIILHLEEAYYSESVGALDCYSAFQFWLHFRLQWSTNFYNFVSLLRSAACLPASGSVWKDRVA